MPKDFTWGPVSRPNAATGRGTSPLPPTETAKAASAVCPYTILTINVLPNIIFVKKNTWNASSSALPNYIFFKPIL